MVAEVILIWSTLRYRLHALNSIYWHLNKYRRIHIKQVQTYVHIFTQRNLKIPQLCTWCRRRNWLLKNERCTSFTAKLEYHFCSLWRKSTVDLLEQLDVYCLVCCCFALKIQVALFVIFIHPCKKSSWCTGSLDEIVFIWKLLFGSWISIRNGLWLIICVNCAPNKVSIASSDNLLQYASSAVIGGTYN